MQGPYRSLKCLKVLEIHHWFFKALKSLKNSTFLVKVLKVLEFLLYNKSYDLKKSSVKITVEEFYKIHSVLYLRHSHFCDNLLKSLSIKKELSWKTFNLVLESP